MSRINFEGDAVTNIKQTGLESVAELLRSQLALEASIEAHEDQLKNFKEQLRKLSEEIIPEKMTELGMTSTEMYDGSKLEIVENIHCSIPKEDLKRQAACYEWLEDNGLGDIIKNQVAMRFGKGEGNKAKHLEETIKEMGLIPEVKVSVHAGTLKATITKWHEEGKSLPEELFFLHFGRKTKISRQNKK